MINALRLLLLFVILFSCTLDNERNIALKELDHHILTEIKQTSHNDYLIFIVTDTDCTDCHINFIDQWISSAAKDNPSPEIVFLLYCYNSHNSHWLKEKLSLFVNFPFIETDNFEIIKQSSLSSGAVSGPFAIKLGKNGKLTYCRKVTEPYL
jgi:hypothetical protein